MRIRYKARDDSKPGDRKYNVQVQEKPRGRWQSIGCVMGLSHETRPGTWAKAGWAGLRDGAQAWTSWKDTRDAAVGDMVAGRTFKDDELDKMRAGIAAREAAEAALVPDLEA
jgi:hypothetical protein